jgi:hypothetical protein
VYSDEAMQADDTALYLKVRDIVRAAFNADRFAEQVQRLQSAQGDRVEKPIAAIEVLANDYGLTELERDSVIDCFTTETDGPTRFGIVQAITAAADRVDTYDRASHLELVGGRVLNLDRKEWQTYAMAA